MLFILSLTLFVTFSNAIQFYQASTHSPCEPSGCNFQLNREVSFNISFNESFTQIPQLAVFVIAYSNMESYGSNFWIWVSQANLSYFNYNFGIWVDTSKKVCFKVGWVATTIEAFQFFRSDKLNEGKQYIINYPRQVYQSQIFYFLFDCDYAFATYEINNTISSYVKVKVLQGFDFCLQFILIDTKDSATTPFKFQITEHQIVSISNFQIGIQYENIKVKDYDSISYGISAYQGKVGQNPITYGLDMNQTHFILNCSNFLTIYNITFSYYTLSYVCSLGCIQCDIAQKCWICQNGMIQVNNVCTCVQGYYDMSVQTCQNCQNTCSGCISNDECTSCLGNLSLTQGQCLCPDGYFQKNDSFICQPCQSPCYTCKEFATLCLSCVQNNTYLNDSKCFCNEGYFDENTNRCENCGFNCMKCYCSGCLECSINYFLNRGKCLKKIMTNKPQKQGQKFQNKSQSTDSNRIKQQNNSQNSSQLQIQQISSFKGRILSTLKNYSNYLGQNDSYQKINLLVTGTGYLANVQIIALLQLLDFPTSENLYYFEACISQVILNKKFPAWQTNPQKTQVSSQRLFKLLFDNQEVSSNLPDVFKRISMTQYIITNMGYGWFILIALLILKWLLGLDQEQSKLYSTFDFILLQFTENLHSVLFLTLFLLLRYPLIGQRLITSFDSFFLIFYLTYYSYKMVRTHRYIQLQLLKEGIISRKTVDTQKFFLQGLFLTKKSFNLVFLNILKKVVTMFLVVFLHRYTVVQLILHLGIHLIFTGLHLYMRSYKRKILNVFNSLLDIQILVLISLRLHNYYYYQNIGKNLTNDQIYDYLEYGWNQMVFELIFVLFATLWFLLRLVINIIDQRKEERN